MKLIAILFFLTATNLCFALYNPIDGMKPFTQPDFALQYPESWTIDTSGSLGQVVSIFSPIENESDKFSENVNVLIQNMAGLNIDLEAYKQITEQQIRDLATDGQIFESRIVREGKKNYFTITYAMTQGIFKLKLTAFCFIQNEKAYLVTFCSEADQYEKYKEQGEQILSSFALINNK